MINGTASDFQHGEEVGASGGSSAVSWFETVLIGFRGMALLAVLFPGTCHGGGDAPAASRFGTDYLWYGINQYYKEENLPTAVDYMKDLKVGSLRVDVHWHFLEPSRDQYDWRMTDLIVNTVPSGTELLFTLYSSARWAIKDFRGKSASNAPKNPREYYDFVSALAARYKGKVKYYQIENEVYGAPNNFWAGTRDEYLELLKTASSAIRKADPDAKILPASVALGNFDVTLAQKGRIPPRENARYRDAVDFLNDTFRNGCGYFDIADIHLYYTLESIPDRLDWFRRILSQNRCNKPIWVTETGGLDPRAYKDTKDERLQAEDLVKRFALAFGSGAQRVFWLAVHRAKDRDHPIFGDIRLTDDPLAKNKKPAYYTLKLLIEKIEGFTSVSGMSGGYKFVVGGKPVLILWADEAKKVDVSSALATPAARATPIVTETGPAFKPVYPLEKVYPSTAVPVSETPVIVEESKSGTS